MTDPNSIALPALPEPYNVASTIKCTACGAPYEPARARAPMAAAAQWMPSVVPPYACKCGNMTFGGTVSSENISPAKHTDEAMQAYARTHEANVRAALAESAGVWQPIETAPKDGAHVLTWWAGAVRVGWVQGAGQSRDGGDWWNTHERVAMKPGETRPTHWMPLPAAPGAAPQSSTLAPEAGRVAGEEFENGVNAWLDNQHPDEAAVDSFAGKMRRKMAAARAKGRGGWQDKVECSAERLSAMLRAHVEKGDPVDVANFCMMLAQRGESIVPAPVAQAVVGADEITERASILRLAAEAMKCPGVAEDLIEGFTMHTEADDIIAIWRAAQRTAPRPEATAGEPAPTDHWTIIAPDGWTFKGEKPVNLILEANRHEREIDPAEADRQDMRLMAAIDEEMAEHKRDRAELVNRFLRWPLPRSVYTDAGTGTVAPSQRPENWSASGTNLLTADEANAMLEFVLDCDEGDRELAHRETYPPAPALPVSADVAKMVEALTRISNGEVMSNQIGAYAHSDTVIAYQKLARETLAAATQARKQS